MKVSLQLWQCSINFSQFLQEKNPIRAKHEISQEIYFHFRFHQARLIPHSTRGKSRFAPGIIRARSSRLRRMFLIYPTKQLIFSTPSRDTLENLLIKILKLCVEVQIFLPSENTEKRSAIFEFSGIVEFARNSSKFQAYTQENVKKASSTSWNGSVQGKGFEITPVWVWVCMSLLLPGNIKTGNIYSKHSPLKLPLFKQIGYP